MTTVNIVTSDRGWILERLAQELARNLPYVTFGDGPDPSAGIQYYMTFACRRRRLSPVEVAYFAHLEPVGEAHDRFFSVARAVEHSVCHARLYEAMLREAGVEAVTTISPGVDLETFTPKLRIGVVGRTYHTGRKGEALVSQVMDIPEIEWSFTGEGWPGPALHLPPEALPDYYRRLDYVLVPALYEGGPMCVVEALACGTEVISPAIGWVPEFPHIEFQVGDAEDLRRVLLELVAKKRELRASVLGRNWDGWVQGHDQLFHSLAKGAGLSLGTSASLAARPPRPPRPHRVGVFLHGNEANALGGPTVRAPRLVRELRENAQEAELRVHPCPKGIEGLDLAHVFNCWAPRSALDLLRRARQAGLATAFSPIFLGIAERDLWEDRLAAILTEEAPGEVTESALASFRAELSARRASPSGAEAAPGFHAALREMCALADHLILLSERERDRLAAIGAPVGAASIVRNPVDAELFAGADPALFRQHIGLDDFVLCVARIEPRKNQAVLAHALRNSGLPLVLVGHSAGTSYRALVEKHAGPGLRILDRLPPNSPLLASAFAAARVAVLPSWSEGAPLAALEAAAAGASLVLSDVSGESEYFGALARYCDPADPASIRNAVLTAWDTRRPEEAVSAQKAFIAENYSWEHHRAETERAYGRAMLGARARARAAAPALAHLPRPAGQRSPIVLDVTTSAHHTGRWTGIARVEAALAIALHESSRADVQFVTWNNKARGFFEVPFEAIKAGRLNRLLAHYDTARPPPLRLPAGAHHIVGGSAWMQNSVYAESVVAFSKQHALRLTPIIHDIIPVRFPFWFDEGFAPVFEQNLNTLLDGAAHVIAVSQSTRRDVMAHAVSVPDLEVPDIAVLREGDEISQIAPSGAGEATAAISERFGGKPFILTVGAIHQRKNHRLLYDVWLKLVARMGPRCPKLVVAGGVGWNGKDVARAFNEDVRLKDHVAIVDGVDDQALDWLYRNCLFTVYPSLYEGWGLPVAESLRYGKPCIASDNSSVPEIAPGLVELLDPADVMAWVTKIQFYAGSATARSAAEARIAREHAGFSWSQSAGQLLDILDATQALPCPTPVYTYGVTVELGDRFAATRIRGTGWHPCERWGCWTRDTIAELTFTPATPPGEALLLVAEVRALSVPNTPFEARVLANGEPVARWTLHKGSLQVMHAVIPAEVARRDASVHITIESGFVLPLRVAAKTEDSRLVGLGMARVMLAPLASVRDAARVFGEPAASPQRIVLGRSYGLLAEGPTPEVLGPNWRLSGAWGMTSNELRPRLEMLLQELPGRDLEVLLRLRPVASPSQPLLVFALINGEQAGAFSFSSDIPTDLRIPVTAAARARGEPVQLDLVPADGRAPAELGLGASAVGFGFGLLAFEVREPGAASRRNRITLLSGDAWEPAPEAHDPLGADWYAPEARGVWSFGTNATLPLRLPDAAVGAMLRITLQAFRPAPGAEDLSLEIRAGKHVLARRRLAAHEAAQFTVQVPASACGPGGELDLCFATDSAPSPFLFGDSADERPLGIRLISVARAPRTELEAGVVCRFATEADGSPPAVRGASLAADWYPMEPGGTWSKGEGGKLLLMPSVRLPQGWRAFALLRVFNAPAIVDVEINDAPLDTLALGSSDIVVTELRDLGARLGGAAGTLTFRRRDPVAPRDVGMGADGRLLGVMLIGLVVLPPEEDERSAQEAFAAAGLGMHQRLTAPLLAQSFSIAVPEPGAGLRLFNWHPPEAEGRWSYADYAEIYLVPPPTADARTLSIELTARVHGTQESGPAKVEARLELGPAHWLEFPTDAYHRQKLEFDVSGLEYDGSEICLWLRRHGAVAPAEARNASDERQRGVFLRRLNVIWR